MAAVSMSTTLDWVSSGMPGTVVDAHEESSSGLGQELSTTSGGGSGGSTTWKALTSVEPAAWGSMVAVTVSVAVCPTPIVPMSQAPVVASKVPKPSVSAVTTLMAAGRVSWATTPVASPVPASARVMVYVSVAPTGAVA